MQRASKATILILEDDKLLNRLVAENLTGLGFGVHSASTWAEGRALLDKHSFDLVVTDMQLPDANGVELLPTLARDQPVIVLTAYARTPLTVKVINRKGQEVRGTEIRILDKHGEEALIRKTDDNGTVRAELKEYGVDGEEISKKSPYTVIVNRKKEEIYLIREMGLFVRKVIRTLLRDTVK